MNSRVTDNRVSECIRRFLRARATPGNADLIAFWNQHCPNLETQVLTRHSTNGDEKANVWSDGTFDWWDIRIPKNAKSDPVFRDYELSWPLDLYAIGVGSTGWDWHHRLSRYVAFDFDAIAGHAKGIGIPNDDLLKIRKAVETVSCVEVRKSTSGNGIHLYVRFEDGIPTRNHSEHAQLARWVLDKISKHVGFALGDHVDAVGGNFWIWHNKLEVSR
jgi:hypothetical protein